MINTCDSTQEKQTGCQGKASHLSPISIDSGTGQTFFPPDFGRSIAASSTPLTPSLEHGGTGMAPAQAGSGQSQLGRLFLFFGISVAIVMVSLEYSVEGYYFLRKLGRILSELDYIWMTKVSLASFILSLILWLCFSGVMRKSISKQNIHTTPVPLSGASSATFGQNVSQNARGTPTSRDFPCRRTFSGQGSEVWHDFRRYFVNLALLNNWTIDYKRRILLCSLRGQAEAFAYGLPENVQTDWELLMTQLEERFGSRYMKESYIADAKLRRKQKTESYREFGQALEDLYRKAYPNNLDFVKEQALTTFLDNCHDSVDFRLSVKRACPKTLLEAVTKAMQEECLRMTEKEKSHHKFQNVSGTTRRGKSRHRGEDQKNRSDESHLN